MNYKYINIRRKNDNLILQDLNLGHFVESFYRNKKINVRVEESTAWDNIMRFFFLFCLRSPFYICFSVIYPYYILSIARQAVNLG